ncbi:MAG: hypothetical protein AB4041_18565 [Microcystaceae cyanobacterium]
MSQSPDSDPNPRTQQTHSGSGDNVQHDKNTTSYYSEIGGDIKGIQGDIKGGTVTQYIITQQSSIEIQQREFKKGSPYKGLRNFRVEDNDKFFGREDWTIRLTDYLKEKSVLLLLGASGSGKSSLIQAGVIPQLMDDFGSNTLVNLTFVPDVNPFESLYGCLISPYGLSNAKKAQIEAQDTLIRVVDELREEDKIWLIFIDQFEELFTRTPKAKRDVFIKALNKLIQRRETKIKIVLTMRADFLDKFHDYPVLGKVHDRSSLMLTEIEESGVRLAIAEPAARNGVIFEDGLVEQIISDFQFKDEEKTGALPLLQYTLDLLWEKEKSSLENRTLTLQTYNEIGGVKGALKLQANKIYNNLLADNKEIVKQILVELIALEGKEAVSRRVRKENFEGDDKQAEVLKKLIDKRLLISQGKGKDATVEVAHEELLRSWDVIINLIEEKRELINLRNRLSADAEQWNSIKQQSVQKAKSELWGGTKLSRVIEFKDEGLLPNLDTVGREFIAASLREETLRKNANLRTAWTIAGISLGGLLTSAIFGWAVLQTTKEAELNFADSSARNALVLWTDTSENWDAWVLALRAGRILQKYDETDAEVLEVLNNFLLETQEQNSLEDHHETVTSVSFNYNEEILASGSRDGTIILWDAKRGQQICLLEEHSKSVTSLSFNHNGTRLASSSLDQTIKLWDVTQSECRLIDTLDREGEQGHDKPVKAISFNHDGTMLASGSYDQTIKLWEVKSDKLIHLYNLKGHNEAVTSVSFNHNGEILASGSRDTTIKLWDVKTGQLIDTLGRWKRGHRDIVNSIKFSDYAYDSDDSSILVSGGVDRQVMLWKVTKEGKGERLSSPLQAHDQLIKSEGKRERLSSPLPAHDQLIKSVSISRNNDNRMILASGGEDHTIKLWEMDERTNKLKLIRAIKAHSDDITSLSFNHDGSILASGSEDQSIKLWRLTPSPKIPSVEMAGGGVTIISFDDGDSTSLASARGDGTIQQWKMQKGELEESLIHPAPFPPRRNPSGFPVKTPPSRRSASFNHKRNILAFELDNYNIQLRDGKTGQPIHTLKGHTNGHTYDVNSLDFNDEGTILASGSRDGSIRLWDVNTGEELSHSPLQEKPQSIISVRFNREGTKLASGGRDNTITLWDVNTGKLIRTLKDSMNNSLTSHQDAIESISFSHDDSKLASGSRDKTIKLWDVKTGKLLHTLKDSRNSTIMSISFNHDSSVLASGSVDGAIKLWDVNTGQLIFTIKGHDDYVTSVDFSKDDQILASGSVDGTIKLWDLKTFLDLDDLIKESCKKVRNYLREEDKNLCP